MFKRIFAALAGNKAGSPGGARAVDDAMAQPEADMIPLQDADGKQFMISRTEWRDKLFLPGLQQQWHDADGLYHAIMTGLSDGFAADLRPAAERLLAIDTIAERAYTTLGIVLMQGGQLAAAEATLRAGLEKVGTSAILLTNLAKVFGERGDAAGEAQTLWQALQADPNQDSALQGWALAGQEQGGDAGYRQALRAVAALPGSWRAPLWLARHQLEHKEVAAARDVYAGLLARGPLDGSALMMMSCDLGTNDQVPLMIELLGPVYDTQQHGPMAGLNLLRAYRELAHVEQGEALLSRMYALAYAPVQAHLDQFAAAFRKMRR